MVLEDGAHLVDEVREFELREKADREGLELHGSQLLVFAAQQTHGFVVANDRYVLYELLAVGFLRLRVVQCVELVN
jgi:hypothetical protein